MQFETIVLGAGPAGTGFLFKAIKDGSIHKLLNTGIAIIEKSRSLLSGSITAYKINSDTLSDAFLECLEGFTPEILDIDVLDEDINVIRLYKGRSIPLNKLGQYLEKLGNLLYLLIKNHPKCEVFLNTEVSKIVIQPDQSYLTYVKGQDGLVKSNQVIIATGGHPFENTISFNNRIPLAGFKEKSFHSDPLIKGLVDKALRSRLAENSRVVILGGSHSAFSSAYYLLNLLDGSLFGKGDIKICSNTTPKLFFGTKQDARDANYTDFDENDFCPITGRLYRLAGLRMDSRELYMRMSGIIPSEPEDRVTLHTAPFNESKLEKELQEAGAVILALGYRFNMIPVYDIAHNLLEFAGTSSGRWVNSDCQVICQDGTPIPNLYLIGLASGFIPSGELGGESSFTGQTNGIWYYQNAMGKIILDQLLHTDLKFINTKTN